MTDLPALKLLYVVAADYLAAVHWAEANHLSKPRWRFVRQASDLRGVDLGQVMLVPGWLQRADWQQISEMVATPGFAKPGERTQCRYLWSAVQTGRRGACVVPPTTLFTTFCRCSHRESHAFCDHHGIVILDQYLKPDVGVMCGVCHPDHVCLVSSPPIITALA